MLKPGGADFSALEHAPQSETDPLLARAQNLLLQGRIGDALTSLEPIERDALSPQDLALLGVTGIVCVLARGEFRATAPFARVLTPLALRPGPTGALATYGLAETEAARGHAEEAVARFTRVGELATDAVTGAGTGPWLPWRSGLARLLAVHGQAAQAARLAEEEVALARESGWSYAVATSLRTRAAVSSTADRIEILVEALASLEGFRADRLESQIRTDLAGWTVLLDPGNSERAVEELRMAERYALAEELWPLIARVRRLLVRLGQEPHQLRAERLAELSPAELRVADLALRGKRNRDIAQQLGISVKSVERHVSQVLRKVGVSSRVELAELIRDSPH